MIRSLRSTSIVLAAVGLASPAVAGDRPSPLRHPAAWVETLVVDARTAGQIVDTWFSRDNAETRALLAQTGAGRLDTATAASRPESGTFAAHVRQVQVLGDNEKLYMGLFGLLPGALFRGVHTGVKELALTAAGPAVVRYAYHGPAMSRADSEWLEGKAYDEPVRRVRTRLGATWQVFRALSASRGRQITPATIADQLDRNRAALRRERPRSVR